MGKPCKRVLESESPTSTKRVKAALDTLPDEILIAIADLLPQQDVLSLMLSSKRFSRPCKIRLYRTIVICEKPQDAFFVTLTQMNGETLLSSWPKILNFFSIMHTNVIQGNTPEVFGYVEEIRSYNCLDSGGSDPYKKLTQADLQQLLSLRQMWDPVLSHFTNLKSLILPNIPLHKILLLPQATLNKIQTLSTQVDTTFEIKSSIIVRLSSVTKLTLNLNPNLIAPAHLNKVKSYSLFTHLFPNVQHLELNGQFGVHDRNLEHTLRHYPLQDELGRTSWFAKGFELGQVAEDELSEDALHDYAEQVSWGNPYAGLDRNMAGRLTANMCNSLYDLPYVKTLTLANMVVFAHKDGEVVQTYIADQLEHGALEGLHFKNVHYFIDDFEFTETQRRSQISYPAGIYYHFTENFFQHSSCLSSLTIQQPIPSEDIEKERVEHWYSGLRALSKSLHKPKSISVELSEFLSLEQAVSYLSGLSDSLEVLTCTDHSILRRLCLRLVSCKATKECLLFENPADAEDELFIASKKVVEFINFTHRVDDYGQTTIKGSTFDYLKDEFIFLFANDARKVFNAFPKLKLLVLYGFPFRKEMLW